MTDITQTINILDGFIDMIDSSGFLEGSEELEIATLIQKIRDDVENKDKIIYNFFRLLDNIDSVGDMCKSDDKCYRNFVHNYQSQRWDFISEIEVDTLYEKYHLKDIKFPDTYECRPVEDDTE